MIIGTGKCPGKQSLRLDSVTGSLFGQMAMRTPLLVESGVLLTAGVQRHYNCQGCDGNWDEGQAEAETLAYVGRARLHGNLLVNAGPPHVVNWLPVASRAVFSFHVREKRKVPPGVALPLL